jgi:PPOX class probable F420-dependent enzyme
MATGYGISPDVDGLLNWPDVAARLAGARNYWIGTTRPDGRPHSVPVWGVWAEAALHFGTDPASVKNRNLRADPRLIVHLESGDDAVVLEGRAELVTEPSMLDRLGEAYIEKYGIDVVGTGSGADYWRPIPGKGLAWGEATFPTTATRFRFPSSDAE